MTTVSEVELVKGIDKNKLRNKYEVGRRVIYKTLFNNPGNYEPGEELPGTVIAVLNNAGQPIYRIELDRVWSACTDDVRGKKILVGNVMEGSILRDI